MPKIVYEPDPPSIGKRLGNFVALIASVVAIVGVIVVSQRLNDQSLALVVGLLLAGIPLLAICAILIIVIIRSNRPREITPQPQQQMMMPPIIMQMPPQQPQLPYYGGNGYERTPQSGRGWDIIGVDEE